MARMIPPVLDRQNTPSPGERLVFDVLGRAPGTEKWTVLHSQRLARVRQKAQGEADFVILVPDLGVLILEVKAHHHVARENGTWLFGPSREPGEDPLAQASKAMHAIRDATRQGVPDTRGAVLFANAVAFTHVLGAPRSPEWRKHQLIEMDEVTSDRLPKAIERAIEDEASHLAKQGKTVPADREGSRLSDGFIEAIVDVLRPNFDLVRSWSAWKRQHEDHLIWLTSQQYSALDHLARNPRVVFEGPAGTGKTVLAMEAARRALDSGDRVLLTCHNVALSDTLKEHFSAHPCRDRLEIATLHKYLLTLTGMTPPADERARATFFAHDLPEKALDMLTEEGGFDRATQGFDTIVIDELQDLADGPHLQLLPELLRAERGPGRIFAFGDLENQAFFDARDAAEVRQTVFEALGPGVVSGNLSVNCRNTRRTVELVEGLVPVSPPYSGVLRTEELPQPEMRSVGSDPRAVLVRVLDGLERKGVHPNDIAVLSLGRSRESLASTVTDERWGDRFRDVDETLGKRHVLATSVYRFKGLERPVIILTDTDLAAPEANPEAWYVGLTRSTSDTIVLVDDETRLKVAGLVAKGMRRDDMTGGAK